MRSGGIMLLGFLFTISMVLWFNDGSVVLWFSGFFSPLIFAFSVTTHVWTHFARSMTLLYFCMYSDLYYSTCSMSGVLWFSWALSLVMGTAGSAVRGSNIPSLLSMFLLHKWHIAIPDVWVYFRWSLLNVGGEIPWRALSLLLHCSPVGSSFIFMHVCPHVYNLPVWHLVRLRIQMTTNPVIIIVIAMQLW